MARAPLREGAPLVALVERIHFWQAMGLRLWVSSTAIAVVLLERRSADVAMGWTDIDRGLIKIPTRRLGFLMRLACRLASLSESRRPWGRFWFVITSIFVVIIHLTPIIAVIRIGLCFHPFFRLSTVDVCVESVRWTRGCSGLRHRVRCLQRAFLVSSRDNTSIECHLDTYCLKLATMRACKTVHSDTPHAIARLEQKTRGLPLR